MHGEWLGLMLVGRQQERTGVAARDGQQTIAGVEKTGSNFVSQRQAWLSFRLINYLSLSCGRKWIRRGDSGLVCGIYPATGILRIYHYRDQLVSALKAYVF